jgi:hypothetical protein
MLDAVFAQIPTFKEKLVPQAIILNGAKSLDLSLFYIRLYEVVI